MTTPPDPSHGVPFLPPAAPDVTPTLPRLPAASGIPDPAAPPVPPEMPVATDASFGLPATAPRALPEPALAAPSPGVPSLPTVASVAAAPDAAASGAAASVTAPAPAPFLPEPPRPAPTRAPEPVFDAKAMVEATKRKVDNPVYGQIPTGTPESRAAAEVLRAKMRRKRQRNKVIGWVVGLVFLGVVGGAGFLAYQAYQDDQEQRRLEREAAESGAAADGLDEPGALTPLGEQTEVIGALDAVNSGVTPSAGGLVGAIDRARQAVDAIGADSSSADAGSGAVDPLAATTFTFIVRRFDTTAPDSAFTQHTYTYDTVQDTVLGDITRSSSPGMILIGTDKEWRLVARPDGTLERAPRSAEGLGPAPDVAFARLITEDLVVPPAIRPYLASATFTAPFEGEGELFAYDLDVAGFAAADPAGFDAWRSFWSAPLLDDPALIDGSRRQTASLDGLDNLADAAPAAADEIDLSWSVLGAAIVYHVHPDGYVDLVSMVDNLHGLRTTYELLALTDDAASLSPPTDNAWIDDPA